MQQLNLTDEMVIGYIGTHGMAHGLPKVIEAAAKMESNKRVVFLFVGDGAERLALERDVQARKLSNVRLLPMQPKERMPEVWSICDVALIPLRNQPLFQSVIPSKLFECMGMGIPVIMSVPTGEATEIVDETGCGLVVEPENPSSLVSAINRLVEDPEQYRKLSRNAQNAAMQFSRQSLAHTMLQLLQSVARGPQ